MKKLIFLQNHFNLSDWKAAKHEIENSLKEDLALFSIKTG